MVTRGWCAYVRLPPLPLPSPIPGSLAKCRHFKKKSLTSFPVDFAFTINVGSANLPFPPSSANVSSSEEIQNLRKLKKLPKAIRKLKSHLKSPPKHIAETC